MTHFVDDDHGASFDGDDFYMPGSTGLLAGGLLTLFVIASAIVLVALIVLA